MRAIVWIGVVGICLVGKVIGFSSFDERFRECCFRGHLDGILELLQEVRPDYRRWNTRILTNESINDVGKTCWTSIEASKLREYLCRVDYHVSSICKRCRVERPVPTIYFLRRFVSHLDRHRFKETVDDALDVCMRLFLIGTSVSVADANKWIDEPVLEVLYKYHLLSKEESIDGGVDFVYSNVMLYPYHCNFHERFDREGMMLFMTDWPPYHSLRLTQEPVMYLGPDSIAMVQYGLHVMEDERRVAIDKGKSFVPKKVIDVCCGSGIQGLVARKFYARHVIFLDVNARALRFTRMNAALNGIQDGVDVLESDVYDSLGTNTKGDSEGQDVDLIIANPPFVPVPDDVNEYKYKLYADGGESGEEILKRVIAEGIGRCHDMWIVTDLLDVDSYEKKVRDWCHENDMTKDYNIHAKLYFQEPTWTCEEYAERRGGSDDYTKWMRNLKKLRINRISTGILMIHMNKIDDDSGDDEKSSIHFESFGIQGLLHPSLSNASLSVRSKD